MPFTRQRPDGTDDAMRISNEQAFSRTRWISRRIPLLALAAIGLLGQGAQAKQTRTVKSAKTEKKMTGVWGWTSGSQTYLRARPSAKTPPVAKVSRHTKLYVWGKFNGWYRVETTDHVFGWVYYDYISAPGADKIAPLSHKKARHASDRTAGQTMYGSKEMLAAHYERYRAPGAARGLKKQGLTLKGTRLAKATKPKSSPRTTARIASARNTSIKRIPGSERLSRSLENASVSDAVFNDVGSVRLAPAYNSNSRRNTSRTETVRTNSASGETQKTLRARESARFAREAAHRDAAKADAAKREAATRKVAKAQAATREAAKREAAKAQAAQSRARLARIEAARAEQARAQAANVQAAKTRAANAGAEKARLANAQAAREARIEAARQEQNAKQAAATRLAAQRRTNYLARVAKREREHKARVARAAARSAARQKKLMVRRDRLRNNMGTPRMAEPPTNAGGMRPISPEELMRAREAYLASQRKNRPATGDTVVVVPAPGNPAFAPMSWKSSRGSGGAVLLPITTKATKASSTPMRGGSPRDRFASMPSNFGNSMANQALTYRGMPYIRGASSPSRGFDCSGLVYYLLQQRGIKAPRTASGMSRMGRKVERGALQSGDVVFFANTYKRGVSHVGVYIGNGNFVHAATSRSGVRVDSLGSAYYRKKWHSARRMSS